MSQRITHGSCGKWWTGASRGHCSGCHETFTQGAFDRHFVRTGTGHPTCDPAGRGLVPHAEPWGTLWALPGTDGPAWWAGSAERDQPGVPGPRNPKASVNTASEAQ